MGKKVKIDMSGVEAFTSVKEGIHTVKLVEAKQDVSQSGNDIIKVVFEVIKGESKGARVFENFTLSDKALWKLKSFLQVVGIKCEGKIALDLDNMVGKVCDIDVFHEEYNGRNQAKIAEFLKPTASKPAPDDDYEDEDENEDDDEEEEIPVPKKTRAKAASVPQKKTPVKKPTPAPDDDYEDEDENEDDDEEEEKPTTPAKKATAKKPKAKKKPEIEDDDDDEEWPEEDDD